MFVLEMFTIVNTYVYNIEVIKITIKTFWTEGQEDLLKYIYLKFNIYILFLFIKYMFIFKISETV